MGLNIIKRSILLTGTAGFIGSNFVTFFLDKYSEYNLINLDLLTYAIDASELEKELNWKANENFDSGIILTIDWYLNKYRVKND